MEDSLLQSYIYDNLKNIAIFWNLKDVTIEGNHSVLFTDNDYRKGKDYQEHFITFSGSKPSEKSKNITIRNLNVETREILTTASDQKYKTQWGFKYIDGVLMEGCEFTIPETVLSKMESKKFEYSILDFYVDWSNVTVRNCKLIDKAGAWYGGCVGFRDIWNGGSENAEFYNNYLYSNCKDEIIAIFSQGATTSCVNNVDIHHNEIIADRCEFVRDICITVCYDTSNQCDNIQIHDNKITGVVDWACFTLGKTLTNSKIYNNEIILKSQKRESGKILTGVVRAEACVSDTNEVFGNSITVEAYEKAGMDVIFNGNANYHNNIVVSDESVTRVFSSDCYAVENDITINGNTTEVGYNVTYMKDNDIDIKGSLTKAGFNYYGSTWGKDYQISENRITIEGDKLAATFIHLNKVTLNGNSFVFQDNVVTTPNCMEGKKLIWLALSDTTPQTIYLAENETGIYQGESYDSKNAQHLISYERKHIEDSKENGDTTQEEGSEKNNKEENSGQETTTEESSEQENTAEESSTKENTTEESSTKENVTEESSVNKNTTEENITKEFSEKITTTEVKNEEKPKEEVISTKKETTEETNKSTSQPTDTETINKKPNSSSPSSTTQKVPFQTQDTIKDPFTVADTGKPLDTKNETQDAITNSEIMVEESKDTSVETTPGSLEEQDKIVAEESDKLIGENFDDKSENEETQKIQANEENSKADDSKDYHAKNNKVLLIFGLIIVAALGGGILILWNYFRR